VISDLEAKRAAAVKHGTDLADERANVALAAHTGDDKAAKRLEEIHAAIVRHGSELASLDAAIRAAGTKVDAAQRAAAAEKRKAAIKEQQKLSKEFRELGPFLDKATDNLRRGLIALKQNASVVGRDFRHVQTLHRVLSVALFDTPFRDAFGVPDSNDRRTFASFSGVVNGWCDSNDASLRHELEALDETKTEAAA
jgi:hypothetical protein